MLEYGAQNDGRNEVIATSERCELVCASVS